METLPCAKYEQKTFSTNSYASSQIFRSTGVKIIEKEECDQRDITEQLGGFDIRFDK